MKSCRSSSGYKYPRRTVSVGLLSPWGMKRCSSGFCRRCSSSSSSLSNSSRLALNGTFSSSYSESYAGSYSSSIRSLIGSSTSELSSSSASTTPMPLKASNASRTLGSKASKSATEDIMSSRARSFSNPDLLDICFVTVSLSRPPSSKLLAKSKNSLSTSSSSSKKFSGMTLSLWMGLLSEPEKKRLCTAGKAGKATTFLLTDLAIVGTLCTSNLNMTS
mmetsp:Transcript_65244/g.115134  ORF Transcript_65244/g.115134 Transcript_65244/m.115134 type:complete len:219 (+) Transcript_65244:490-1146(+)